MIGLIVCQNSVPGASGIVAQTKLLGWLPEPLFAAEQAAGPIRPVRCDELVLPRRFFVYRRRRNFMAPPLQQFLQALQK